MKITGQLCDEKIRKLICGLRFFLSGNRFVRELQVSLGSLNNAVLVLNSSQTISDCSPGRAKILWDEDCGRMRRLNERAEVDFLLRSELWPCGEARQSDRKLWS